jgi:hypothetical protein
MMELDLQGMNGLGVWCFYSNKLQNPSGPIGSIRSDRIV